MTFSPLLAIAAAMVFLFQAGVLAGLFYFAALAMFATAVLMAIFPQVGVLLFGIVTAACFFFPGLKYYRPTSWAGREVGEGAFRKALPGRGVTPRASPLKTWS